MALTVRVIVEYGAQKQRIFLDANSSYQDICSQIYSLFKLDPSKSKYILQQQDSSKPGIFSNIDQRIFLNALKQAAINTTKNSIIRLRLVPATSKVSVIKSK